METDEKSEINATLARALDVIEKNKKTIIDTMLTSRTWRVLIVDDTRLTREMLQVALGEQFTLFFAKDGRSAIDIAIRKIPDIILLDIMMPGMDGYAVCRWLKRNRSTARIPIIFITAKKTPKDEIRGFDAGCVDYITKPFSLHLVRARVQAHIALVDQCTLIERLSLAGEYKDSDTGAHVKRIGLYSGVLARKLGLPDAACEMISLTAPMHDIGKIGIPDRILLKPAKLTDEERVVMCTHAELGAAILGGDACALMRLAAGIALTHHERWDGSGYPNHVSGHAIPIEGRIVAVADVFDALISRRPYKSAWPVSAAIDHVMCEAGKHFDPEIVAAFLSGIDELTAIHDKYPG